MNFYAKKISRIIPFERKIFNALIYYYLEKIIKPTAISFLENAP